VDELRRVGIVGLALALISVGFAGCARQPRGGTVFLDVSPGEGTITITDRTSGGRTVCAHDCSLTLARGSRVDAQLQSRRPGQPTVTRGLRLDTDLGLHGEWDDRSGERVAGGVALAGGLVIAATLLGIGGAIASDLPNDCSGGGLFGCVPPATVTWIGFGVGAAVPGLVGVIVGTFHLAMNDRPIITTHRRAGVALSLAPLGGGAMLGVAGDLY
jgi:hypothetical protein